MPNLFDSIQLTRPNSNMFDLSHDVKLSLNMGELVPILCTECVPGDKIRIGADSMIRLAPMVAPPMHVVNSFIHYFFVPNRILWPNWDNFISNTPNPVTSSPYAFPTIDIDTNNQTRLTDYLDIPPTSSGFTETISCLPFAAYQRIWFEYYRDQNLQPEQLTDFQLTDGDNTGFDSRWFALRKRCWEHDYFTAALPFAQKGDAATIPLGEVALKPDAPQIGLTRNSTNFGFPGADDLTTDGAGLILADGTPQVYDPNGSLQVEPTTINSLRRAYRLQEFFEKMARGGSRIKEVILNFFGVRTSDSRLNRPEYISGSKSGVVFSEVQNTTGTVTAPQGTLAGHGISVDQGKKGTFYCEEHGYIIGILSVLPQTAYAQGIPKHFLKTADYTQYYWPTFANLGEQEVLNKELYAFQSSAGNNTFGYVPRYAEYKFQNSRVAGDFRGNLDYWTMFRKFSSPPALNGAFVEADPTHRIFAVTDPSVQKLYAHVYHKLKANRLMPKYGTPTF